MSQADYVLSNQSRTSYRSEHNATNEAIATLNSGTTAPSTTYENQFWVDTTNNLLKQRNSANTAWVIVGKIDVDGWIKENAGSPISSITPDYEKQWLYDTSNNLMYYANGTANTDWTAIPRQDLYLPKNYSDGDFEYISASSIKVLADSRFRSSDDTTDIVFSSDETMDLTVSGAGGLDTGSEAVSTWYHIYAIYNPTTDTSKLLASTVNEEVGGSITLPSGYTKKRQIFVIRNNSSGDVEEFAYSKNDKYVQMANEVQLLNNGPAITFTAIANMNLYIPATAKKAKFTTYMIHYTGSGYTSYTYVRPTGSSAATGNKVISYINSSPAFISHSFNTFDEILGTNQQIDYRGTAGVDYAYLWLQGYYLNL